MKVQLNNYYAPIEAVVKNTVATTNHFSRVYSVIAPAVVIKLSPEASALITQIK